MSRDIEREVRKRYAERRERIATAVFAGMYANPVNERAMNEVGPHLLASWAVTAADALLAELTAAGARDSLRALEAERKTESEVTA